MDVKLREAAEDELDYIFEKFREKPEKPYFIKDIHYIMSMRRIRKMKKYNFSELSVRVLPTFYVPRSGDLRKNCTLFAISGDVDHVVWFTTMEEDTKELRDCLFHTKLIKWSEAVLFATIHLEHVHLIHEFCQLNDVPLQNDEEAAYYWLAKDKAILFDVEPPTGTCIRELTKKDAKACFQNWIYASKKSEKFLESLIHLNGGYGIFSVDNDELLCFAIFNEQLAIGMLTTLDKAKRKGYGETLAKFMSRKCVEKFDIPPVAFTNNLNAISISLFIGKLGYEKIAESNWIAVGNKKY